MWGNAQVSFFYDEKPVSGKQAEVWVYADTSMDRTLSRYSVIQPQMTSLSSTRLSLNYQNKMVWLRIPLSFWEGYGNFQYLMLRNPHINYVNAWLFKKDSLVKSYPNTGDHIPFSSRPTHFPDFIFPVPDSNQHQNALVILLDKRNEQINIPIHALSESGLNVYNRKKNLLAGFITGLSLFLVLFSLFLYYNMRERLYVYYGLYILTAFLYIFSDYGYLFMYFFPNHPFPADFTRPLSISLATPLYMLFAMQLLNIRENLPGNYYWCKQYLWGYALTFTSCMLFLPQTGTIRIILIFTMQVFQNITSLVILLTAIAGWRKKIPYSTYIIYSSLVLLISFFFFMLFISGWIEDTFFTRNLMNIGFSLELSILAFVLTLRFKNYKLQLEQTLRQVQIQQEQIFKSITDYQEKEMQRVSSLLHDSVGAMLSTIRLNLESTRQYLAKEAAVVNFEGIISDVNNLANEVRTLSHNLSPLLLQEKGLVESLRQIMERINSSGELYIQFENIGSLNKVSFRYEVLTYNIVQELIQNILKHAMATEAIIQLILEKEIIAIFVEDNGRGFDNRAIQSGLGFFQIKQLIAFVNGNFSIDSEPGNGCRITIEFRILPDEINLPYSHS